MVEERRQCSVPNIGGLRGWFEPRFGDLCAKHDRRYVQRKLRKWDVDLVFAVHVYRRGYRLLAAGAWIMFWSPIGFWYWYTE